MIPEQERRENDELYWRVVRMLSDLHPALWHVGSWEIGRAIEDRIVKLKNLAGQYVYRAETGTFLGWRVEWVDGDDLRVVVGPDRQTPWDYLAISPEEYRGYMDRVLRADKAVMA